MTKKDFQLIADTLASLPSHPRFMGSSTGLTKLQTYEIAIRFADALSTTNPKFDRVRFLKACGV